MVRHIAGRASKYTASRLPIELVHSEPVEVRPTAIARERQLKGWTRAKKEALVAGHFGSRPSLGWTGESDGFLQSDSLSP